jgi:hypothetical protein
MEWFVIDAIGPFFRGYDKPRINWSKIPFPHLMTSGDGMRAQWDRIATDLRRFAMAAKADGYNTVTLDDLAHLAPDPRHESEIAERIAAFRSEFGKLFDLLKHEYGMRILLTSDVLPATAAIEAALGTQKAAWEDYYHALVARTLEDFPQIDGLVLRIGESDGHDVKDPIRTRLHLRNPRDTNHLIKRLLPEFEKRDRVLILRTWTVGAHRIGDMIWHRGTLAQTLDGLDSLNFIVSMKHGESDFFRYLPLNKAFFRVRQRKIIELQARREYEGAGEYPSFIGHDCERFRDELRGAENMVGMSVWCQTGGWHRFRRLTHLEDEGRDVWTRLNTAVAAGIFKENLSVEECVGRVFGLDRTAPALELLRLADTVIHELLYVEEFARQKLFFRRVRIPPILHVYWDGVFINHAVRKVMRNFVSDPERALRAGESAAELFPRMIELARDANLPVADIEHMRDAFAVMLLARRYYFLPYDDELANRIRCAKKRYKQRWPSDTRQRYRIKISFEPFKVKRRTLAWGAGLLLRKQRGYRWVDRVFTLHLLGFLFHNFRRRDPKAVPKFLRKSAMGIDVLFK